MGWWGFAKRKQFKYRPNNTKLHKDRVHANPNLPRIRMGSKERAGAKIAM